MGGLLHNNDPKTFASGKSCSLVCYFETAMGFDLGRYAPGYNPKVHGPYWPGRNYQSVDTKLMDVKLGELPSWLRRRPMGLRPLARVANQEYWRWQRNWNLVRYPSFAAAGQICCVIIAAGWFARKHSRSFGEHARYH